MRLVTAHARAMTVELLRYPAYLVPTLAFPPVFFLFFAAPGAGEAATGRMAAFAGFAVIGVAFFQFGVGIAVERATPWEAYLRTLPIGPVVRLTARVMSAAVFAVAAGCVLVVVALATTTATMSPGSWSLFALSLLLGTAPFALLGIALGYWSPARGALPIANLLYLSLSYAGGLWLAPRNLPTVVRKLSPVLPTRAFADTLVASTGGTVATGAWLVLAAFSLLFGSLTAWGYTRDEGRRFR